MKRRDDMRRTKLYYLRQRSGKSARIEEELIFEYKEAATKQPARVAGRHLRVPLFSSAVED